MTDAAVQKTTVDSIRQDPPPHRPASSTVNTSPWARRCSSRKRCASRPNARAFPRNGTQPLMSGGSPSRLTQENQENQENQEERRTTRSTQNQILKEPTQQT
ncbi:hypothetical protein EYF80_056842 [Liparis tanakae]|uniref:Uncharacterized protein n=1 Tax=Liparis tanakae TaxID=230148 RepID=A0A4Z2EW29_9TELE|nr:hypothetical protein EYF80_056842 [Liparis tanakae]